MIVALSCVSSHGLWIICDPKADSVLSHASWFDSDSTGLSAGLGKNFDLLLKQSGVEPAQITHLFGVTGPGSFTGLRMSSAFLQGLSQGLGGLPLTSVPTFDLAGREFFIPLRHQKARECDLPQALGAGIEFLKLSGATGYETATPSAQDLVWGLKDKSQWPQPDDLLKGVRRNLRAPAEGLRVLYGLEPKISGVRS